MLRQTSYKIIIFGLVLIIFVQLLFILKLSFKPKVKKIVIPPTKKPSIAIVIDDWGYNLDNLEILKQIAQPLTLAILPHLEYSQEIANFSKALGKEIILHLPLEPKRGKDYLGWEKFTITIDMPEEKIRKILEGAIEGLSGIRGVSNHMGSRATENERIMRIIFKELKKRGLYFLDNRVSANSICRKVALELSLGFASRDIFLDNQKESVYIKNQLKKLKMVALKKNEAVAVAHAYPLTLEVLKEEIPKIEKEGFRFVFLSQLIKNIK